MKLNKHEKDREKIEIYVDKFRYWNDEKLIKYSTIGGGNKYAIQAMNNVLKERGLK